MQLKTFGKVCLADCGFSRPKPLLLLAYLTIEGPQSRAALAQLFWNTKNGKASLSVVLSQFKKECSVRVLSDQPGIDPLPSLITCDAQALLEAIERRDLERVLELYQGSFLHDFGKPLADLELSGELLDWVLEKREFYAAKVQNLLLEASENLLNDGDTKRAQLLAERAYNLPDAPELEPAMLSTLQRVLGRTNSDVAVKLERTIKDNLADLPEHAQRVFLALSLQEKINLTIVRNALELPLTEVARAQEDLFMVGLIDAEVKVTAPDLASNWLLTHSSQRLGLLIALARVTPPEDAFLYYQQLYQLTQGFGGIGDFQRARTAYCAQAKSAMDRLEFTRVITLLEPLFTAQKTLDAEPHPESTFLLSYALERTGRFKDAFDVISTLPDAQETPNTIALKSNLLWRIGKNTEAKTTAERALEADLEWFWAKATAHNTLGYLASSSGDFTEATSSFKKSASLYQVAGDKNRWVGALNNYAVELTKSVEHAQKLKEPLIDITLIRQKAMTAYHFTLDALEQTAITNDGLRAKVFLNLGSLYYNQNQFDQAETMYKQADHYAKKIELVDVIAQLNLNFGLIYLHRNQKDDAKQFLRISIEAASKTGDMATRILALSHLSVIQDDVDDAEVVLEIIKSQMDVSKDAFAVYGEILRKHFSDAMACNRATEATRILKKAKNFCQKFNLFESANLIQEKIQDITRGAQVDPNTSEITNIFEQFTYKRMTEHAF